MIYYLIGGTILVTFLASVWHFFCVGGKFLDFYKRGGLVTVSFVLTIGLCVIGCVYGSVGVSILTALTILIPLAACVIHYFDAYRKGVVHYLIHDFGWALITILGGIPLTICLSIYVNTLWSLVIGIDVILSAIFIVAAFSETCSKNAKEFLTKYCGWVYPLFFLSIAATILCAVYFNTANSLIIGITTTIMIFASFVHYGVSESKSFLEFFADKMGWLTNTVFLAIGLAILGIANGYVWESIYWAVPIVIMVVVEVVEGGFFENCFTDGKGLLFVSICGLFFFTIYGFIFWEAAKTFVVMLSIIAVLLATVIHNVKSKSYNLENFLYDKHGFLTISISILLCCSIFQFIFCEIFYTLTTILILALSILMGIISKKKINEAYFVAYFGAKHGAIYSYLPLLVGGIVKGVIWSNWSTLIISTVIYFVVYIACIIMSIKKGYFKKKKTNTIAVTPNTTTSTNTLKTTPITTTPKSTTPKSTTPKSTTPKPTTPKPTTPKPTTPKPTTPKPTTPKPTTPKTTTPVTKSTETTVTIDDTPIVVEENKSGELILDVEKTGTLVIDTDND